MDHEFLNSLMKNGGTTAQKLLAANMDVSVLRTNATLRKDEWKEMDDAIIDEHQGRLVGVADLEMKGNTFTVANGLGKTILESENVDDLRDAQVSMDGVTTGQNETVNYEVVGIPLPFIHKDYQIPIRKLNASRNVGESLDTTQARLASRKVADTLEGMLFNGYSSFAFGGYTIYGYTDWPSKLDRAIGTDWATDTGANILTDVLAAKQLLINAKMYGPYAMYIPANFETKMDEDYSTAKGDNTIRDRILAVKGFESLKVADKLTSSKVVIVQMTQDVVRMVKGLPLTNVEWESKGGMIFNFKVMTIQVPELRTDQAGNAGVCVIA